MEKTEGKSPRQYYRIYMHPEDYDRVKEYALEKDCALGEAYSEIIGRAFAASGDSDWAVKYVYVCSECKAEFGSSDECHAHVAECGKAEAWFTTTGRPSRCPKCLGLTTAHQSSCPTLRRKGG